MSNIAESIGIIRQILQSQYFAVLTTLRNQQPYSSLVAFAVSEDLRHIIWATNRNSQKYRNILSNDNVAMLIDNRSNSHSDLTEATAITALGIASEPEGDISENIRQSYLKRHQPLAGFIEEKETAIISVTVTDYIVARFDRAERIKLDDVF